MTASLRAYSRALQSVYMRLVFDIPDILSFECPVDSRSSTPQILFSGEKVTSCVPTLRTAVIFNIYYLSANQGGNWQLYRRKRVMNLLQLGSSPPSSSPIDRSDTNVE